MTAGGCPPCADRARRPLGTQAVSGECWTAHTVTLTVHAVAHGGHHSHHQPLALCIGLPPPKMPALRGLFCLAASREVTPT